MTQRRNQDSPSALYVPEHAGNAGITKLSAVVKLAAAKLDGACVYRWCTPTAPISFFYFLSSSVSFTFRALHAPRYFAVVIKGVS